MACRPGSLNMQGMALKFLLHTIIQDISTDKPLPTSSYETVTCPIHKKGDQLDCGDFGEISHTLTKSSLLFFINVFSRLLKVKSDAIDAVSDSKDNYRPNFLPENDLREG